jgi:PAS domain S-box-containing protein
MTKRQDESRLRAVVETAVDGVILIDAHGCIQMFNPACEKLFGYRVDEVIGQNVKMLMPAPYRQEHDGYLGNFRRTGEKKIIGIGRTVTGQRKDGSTFPMDLSVGESKEGNESIFVGIIHDLSEHVRAEQEIRETAARFEALVDTAVDGVMTIDAKGGVQMFNPACEKLFGYRADEVIGQNVKMLMPAPYHAEHDGYLETFHRTGEKKIIGIGREVAGRRRDGTTFPIYLSVGEARQNGQSIFVGIIHDLTDQKRAQHALQEREQTFRLLLDGMTDYAIYMLDPEGCVVSWNRGAQRIKQYAADEILGRHFSQFYSEEERQTGEPERALQVAAREGKYEAEGWRVRRDGSRFWASGVIDALRNGAGKVVGFGKITRDITERRRAEQEIQETAARFKALVDTAVDGVIMIDAHGLVQMFNPACEKLFGYRAGEVIGQNVKMLMPPHYSSEHDGYLENFHRSGERKIIGIGREVVGQRKDGTTFPMDLSVGEARQESEPIFVGIIHDLTGRKQTEAQLIQAQKMETIGQLSGGIAHDFNNLLTVVVGNAEILSETLRSRPDLQHFATGIVLAGERGAELTQRLLAFGRRQTLQPIEVDCNALVTEMEKLLRRMLAETISIRAMLDSDLWITYADPGQLENAIINLAINARDAMGAGGTLTITTANVPLDARYRDLHPEVKPGEYVMVAVTDNGSGMPKEVLEHVFEPFFTTKEVGKGSGLGLSMVYGFVKQSNGHVAIYSEPALGTTVRIYLPAVAGTVGKSPRRVQAEPAAEGGKEVVLVAEDDPFVRSYAVTSLSSLGYKVVEAADGREALHKLSEGAPADILFTDIVMPGGINGWDLAERARNLRPGLRVLLTSGYALETLAERGRLPPGAVILNKPYRKAELARRLREALSL